MIVVIKQLSQGNFNYVAGHMQVGAFHSNWLRCYDVGSVPAQ